MGRSKKTVIEKYLGSQGRMISASKGRYRKEKIRNLVIFNANIVDSMGIKIWHGDIDITEDRHQLWGASDELKERLFILYEMDARFENEAEPKTSEYAYYVDAPQGTHNVGRGLLEYYELEKDTFLLKKEHIPEPITDKDRAKVYGFSVPKEDIIGTIGMFKAVPDNKDPFEMLGELVKTNYPDVECIDEVVLSTEDCEKLNAMYIKYLRENGEELGAIDDYEIDKAITWGIFCNGPSAADNLPSGKIYIRCKRENRQKFKELTNEKS